MGTDQKPPNNMNGNIILQNQLRQAKHLQQAFKAKQATSSGFTLDYTGKPIKPMDGYAVGIHAINPDDQSGFLKAVQDNYCVGYWEGDTDLVKVIDNRAEAIQLALDHNQKAIYDFANQEVIYVTPRGAQAV